MNEWLCAKATKLPSAPKPAINCVSLTMVNPCIYKSNSTTNEGSYQLVSLLSFYIQLFLNHCVLIRLWHCPNRFSVTTYVRYPSNLSKYSYPPFFLSKYFVIYHYQPLNEIMMRGHLMLQQYLAREVREYMILKVQMHTLYDDECIYQRFTVECINDSW